MSLYDLPKELLIKIIIDLQETDPYVIKILEFKDYYYFRLLEVLGPYYNKEKAYQDLYELLGNESENVKSFPEKYSYNDGDLEYILIGKIGYTVSKLSKIKEYKEKN